MTIPSLKLVNHEHHAQFIKGVLQQSLTLAQQEKGIKKNKWYLLSSLLHAHVLIAFLCFKYNLMQI